MSQDEVLLAGLARLQSQFQAAYTRHQTDRDARVLNALSLGKRLLAQTETELGLALEEVDLEEAKTAGLVLERIAAAGPEGIQRTDLLHRSHITRQLPFLKGEGRWRVKEALARLVKSGEVIAIKKGGRPGVQPTIYIEKSFSNRERGQDSCARPGPIKRPPGSGAQDHPTCILNEADPSISEVP
jgi:hypothetical protein